jgi:hypothetical protein
MGAGKGRARRSASATGTKTTSSFEKTNEAWLKQVAETVAQRYHDGHYQPMVGFSEEGRHLQGKKVVVPSGVPMRSTNPTIKGWVLTKRRQTVTVDHVLPGSEDGWSSGNITNDPAVRWAGSGDYWHEVPIDFVRELITPPSAQIRADLSQVKPVTF